MEKQKHLVLVAVYELMDQNRDEKVGSVQALKKLHRVDGVYTFISKYSYRHHLFNALRDLGWKESCVMVIKEGNKQVVQFDLSKDDILTSPELDAFGYMYTIKKETSITRKAPVGLTDVISLEPFNGDSVFYANHDMVRRGIECGYEANPNPFIKEEHYSYYKGGMTINLNRLGIDEWIIDVDKVEWLEEGAWKKEGEDKGKNKIDEDKGKNKIDFSKVTALKISLKQDVEKIIPDLILQNEPAFSSEYVKICINKYCKLMDNIKIYEVKEKCENNNSKNNDKIKNCLIIGKLKGNERKYKIIFLLSEKKLKKRIEDLIETYINGFKFQVGGRDYAMVPVFCAVAITKSPLQVFFPNIGINPLGNGRFEITGLVASIANSKVEKVYLGWNTAKIEIDEATLKEKVKDKLHNNNQEIINLCETVDKEKIIEEILKEVGFNN